MLYLLMVIRQDLMRLLFKMMDNVAHILWHRKDVTRLMFRKIYNAVPSDGHKTRFDETVVQNDGQC